MRRFAGIIIVTLAVAISSFVLVVNTAGEHASFLVKITDSGQERVFVTQVRGVLVHLASIDSVRKMNSKSCEAMDSDFTNSKGLFGVLALGDRDGNTICIADPKVTEPLPSMADRLYFEKAKNTHDMVTGEFVWSKTTGLPTLHFAYPIRDNNDQFLGVVMAGVNLDWFSKVYDAEKYLDHEMQVMAVDRTGKLLFELPTRVEDPGTQELTGKLLSAMLAGDNTYRFLKGADGHYRVYAYEPIAGSQDSIYIVAGVGLSSYIKFVGYVTLVTFIFALYIGWWKSSLKK